MPTTPVASYTVRVARKTSGPFARMTIAGPRAPARDRFDETIRLRTVELLS